MKLFSFLLSFFLIFIFGACNKEFANKNDVVINTNIGTSLFSKSDSIHYLALGDSYTVGVSIDFNDNYPNQTTQLLSAEGYIFSPIQIIAKNGWAASELKLAIDVTLKRSSYELVTLLIGVNNQFRGQTVTEFSTQFNTLIKTAIALAGNQPKRVFILSLPDLGITPFAEFMDKKAIANDIDAYNQVCEMYAKLYGTIFLNITDRYRLEGYKAANLSSDKLHPSKLEYTMWAIPLAQLIKNAVRE